MISPLLFVVAAEIARLVGQDVRIAGDQYEIRDVAGEGAPLVGVVERRGAELWLVTAERANARAVRLVGPLAHPRIAGPGYKVWVLGTENAQGLHARRIGILAPPPESQNEAVTPTVPTR